MHARVQLDMHRPSCDTLLLGRMNQRIHQSEGIDLWFQVVVKHRLEGRHLRIHNHDVLCDAITTERHARVGNGHSEVVDTMVLQRLGYLYGTCTIGIRLHHTYQFGFRFQERTVVVQVIHHCIEVHLQDGLMHLLLQQLRQMIEAKDAGTFQQDDLIMQVTKDITGDKLLDTREERLVSNNNDILVRLDGRTNTYQAVDASFQAQVADLAIEG